MVNPKKLEELIWDARARVTWGESRESIANSMLEQGVDPNLVDEILAASMKERASEVRSIGVKEFLIGLVIGALFGGLILAMVTAQIGSGRLLGWMFVGAMYGLFRFVRGLFWLVQGKNVSGSLSELGDEVM